MILRAFRVVKRRHLSSAFDGRGAWEYGGRWNSPGCLAVYLAGHVSLAILEVIVHADLALASHYLVIPVTFEERLVEILDAARLPTGWRAHPAPAAVTTLGDEWLRSARSPVLRVPSAVVPSEANYVLNPVHPRFGEIEIGKAEILQIDPRLSRPRR